MTPTALAASCRSTSSSSPPGSASAAPTSSRSAPAARRGRCTISSPSTSTWNDVSQKLTFFSEKARISLHHGDKRHGFKGICHLQRRSLPGISGVRRRGGRFYQEHLWLSRGRGIDRWQDAENDRGM